MIATEMNILELEMRRIRQLTYQMLKSYVLENRVDAYEVETQGHHFQIEIQYFWDGNIDGNIRVIGSICKRKSLSQFFKPTSVDFIISPNGQLVDE